MVTDRSGKNVAIAGILLTTVFSAVLLALWRWTGSAAAMACTWFLAMGVLLHLAAALLLYARQLARQEAIELEEISQAAKSGAIFDQAERQELRPAARRAAWMQRWVVPLFTLLWAGGHVAIALLTARYLSRWGEATTKGAAHGLVFSVLIGFVAFLFSRYSTGMSRRPEWRPLRATGGYLLVGALFLGGVAVAFAMATQGYERVGLVVAYVIPIVQILLAAEMGINLVLDVYRPRLPGQEARLSFDSRLFGLIAEPERVGRSIAEAVNYQFGFEVSKTWFYQLVGKAFVPLLAAGVLILMGISAIVVVEDGQQCVVLHWGRPDAGRTVLQPGIHLKWPWPIDTARRFDVGAVRQILLGVGDKRPESERSAEFIKEGTFAGRELYLWTQEHGEFKEENFLVAIPPEARRRTDAEESKIPAVNIIRLVVPVYFRVVDVYRYGFEVADALEVLRCAAYREMVRYCASATLTDPVPGGSPGRPEAIMTCGRETAARELKDRIQAAADGLRLGVEIVYVGLDAVHPPTEAAEAYQDVLKAQQRQDQMRYSAEAWANETLARVAGDPADALRLALAIRRLGELDSLKGLRADRPRFDAELAGDMARVGEDLRALDEEIERERLLGQVRPGRQTPRQQLRREYQVYLDLLRDVQQAPDRFDFDGQIEGKTGARALADALFDEAAGEPAAEVAKAAADRWTVELGEKARVELFASELQAYRASPNVYVLDRRLDVLDRVLPNVPKYVLAVDRKRLEVRLNLEKQAEYMQGVTFKAEAERPSE